jgi:hypothetical protein
LTKKKHCLYKNRNQFIGTQDNTYNLGSSRYLAGLIAHEGTHWKQKQGVRNFVKINWQQGKQRSDLPRRKIEDAERIKN